MARNDATYYVLDGELRHAGNNTPVAAPAVLINVDPVDTGMATVLRCGEAVVLQKELESKSPMYAASGLGKLVLIEITKDADLETQCYVLRRCLEFSASSFPAELCRRMEDGTAGAWLTEEMQRVPLN